MNIFGGKPKEGVVFSNSYLGLWINVYPDRVEFISGGTGTQSVSLNQISGVEEGSFGYAKVTIFTTSGHKYVVPTGKKREVREAILEAQSKYTGNSGHVSKPSDADEILKLNELKEKGIITEAEFTKKKKQLLGM